MAKEISKTQIDRLGERLKRGKIEDDDLRMLDQYRRSFAEAYELAIKSVRKKLALVPTGRPAKSTPSIVDKLRRESIRLTQIQDIAGCRIVVADIDRQDEIVQSLSELFDEVTVVDRRERPSNGYRAVHVIVRNREKPVEIQVRTSLQQIWAEVSEKCADMFGQEIKYGKGLESVRVQLTQLSALVEGHEQTETSLIKTEALLLQLRERIRQNTQQDILLRCDNLIEQQEIEDQIHQLYVSEKKLWAAKMRVFKLIHLIARNLETMRGSNDFSDPLRS